MFFDADGVVVNFNGHCETRFGAHPHHLTFQQPGGKLLKGDAALWAHVETDDDFWLDMPFFDHAHELVDMGRAYNAQFLTGCPAIGYDRASAHKKEKLGNTFGIPVITCRSRDKALHMIAPGDILVDDFMKNIKRWEEAGGIGIHFKTFEQAADQLRFHLSNV